MTNALGHGDVAGARNSFFQTLVLGFGASILLAVGGSLATSVILEARFSDRPEMVGLA